MAVQTTYSATIAAAVPGMIADMTKANVDTRVVETAAGIGFGVACGQGSADKGVVLGASAATGFVGISVRDVTLTPENPDEYQRYANAGILTEGDIWVTTGGIVAAGNDVTFNKDTGVLSTASADASNFAITGARWMTSAASGALAIVRLTGALPSA